MTIEGCWQKVSAQCRWGWKKQAVGGPAQVQCEQAAVLALCHAVLEEAVLSSPNSSVDTDAAVRGLERRLDALKGEG